MIMVVVVVVVVVAGVVAAGAAVVTNEVRGSRPLKGTAVRAGPACDYIPQVNGGPAARRAGKNKKR